MWDARTENNGDLSLSAIFNVFTHGEFDRNAEWFKFSLPTTNMDLSGLNKALHLLHSKKFSTINQSFTIEEIVSNVNIILEKISNCDQEKIMVFEPVTGNMVRSASSCRYDVYTVLKSLDNMVEVVDAVEQGFSRLELTGRGARPMSVYDWPWYGFQDVDNFLEPPAVHQRLKKLGIEAIQELHSRHILGNVCISEEDMASSKFRFGLSSKFSGNLIVYVIPAVEIDTRPRCVRTDIPSIFEHHKIMLTADYSWGLHSDDRWRTLWHVSPLTIEQAVFMKMDCDGGLRYVVRNLVHFLCEKYVHYPVTRRIVDTLLAWNISGHVRREDWVEEKLALRVLEILENLRRSLRNHRVRNYYIPACNLIEDVDGLKLDKAAERLQHLITKLQENPNCLQLFVG